MITGHVQQLETKQGICKQSKGQENLKGKPKPKQTKNWMDWKWKCNILTPEGCSQSNAGGKFVALNVCISRGKASNS